MTNPTRSDNRPVARPVHTDRPGEAWPNVADAARAVGVRSRTTILEAIDRGWRCAGRFWFDGPSPEQLEAAAEAERHRARSVRCNPGRRGYIVNGTDARTGKAYAGGRVVTAAEGAATCDR